MKVKSTSAIMAFIAATFFGLQTVNAQTGSWKLAGNNLAGTEKLGSTNNAALKFFTSNKTRMTLTGTGSLGINTSAPKAILHVFKGSAGTIADFSSPSLVVENSTNNYINLRSPNVSESGILFGNPAGGSADGGIIYNSSGNLNGLQFRTNGNIIKMVVTNGGSVGIGTTTPSARLDLGNPGEEVGLFMSKSGNNNGVQFIKTSTTSSTATLSVATDGFGEAILANSANGNGIFAQTFNSGAFAGFFSGNVFATGNYQSSDEKLKQNIRDFTSAMGIINKLHPKLYQFKKEGNYRLMNLPQGDHYGLIAQEVEKVLPNLVKDTKFDTRLAKHEQTESSSPADEVDFKALNYTELIPILIKAMQEQDAKIESLTQLVNKLQGSQISSVSQSIAVNTASLSSASLDQNIPNPLTNSTSIRYSIPAGSSKALLIITDNNGNTVKQVLLNSSSNGSVNIETSTLSSGTYSYTLIVDGKTIETKKMVIVR